jgi:hypothetical protein
MSTNENIHKKRVKAEQKGVKKDEQTVSDSETQTQIQKEPGRPRYRGRFAQPILVSIPRLIILIGKTGAGKTHVAKILSLLGYQSLSISQMIKEEMLDLIREGTFPSPPSAHIVAGGSAFDYMGADNWETYKDLTERFRLNQDIHRILFASRPAVNIRRLIQWYGTEHRRAGDPNYWVDKIAGKLNHMVVAGPVVIENARFPEELKVGRLAGVMPLVVRINRTYQFDEEVSPDVSSHVSETRPLRHDFEIDNNGEVASLIRQISIILFSTIVKTSRMHIKLPKSLLENTVFASGIRKEQSR